MDKVREIDTQLSEKPYWERNFVQESALDVARVIERYSIDPETVRKIEIPQDLKLTDEAVAKKLETVGLLDPKLEPPMVWRDQDKVGAWALTLARASAWEEETTSPKLKRALGHLKKTLNNGFEHFMDSVPTPVRVGAAGTGLVVLAGCAPGPIAIAPMVEDGVATEAYAPPTESLTATSKPTEAPSPTSTPEAIAAGQALTEKDLEAGHWGAFTFSKNENGFYDVKDSKGEQIPNLELFEDGTASLKYNNKDLTIAFQVITQKDGALVTGLWDYKEGKWQMETYQAPKNSEESQEWRSLAIIEGHAKEQEMLSTVFLARDLATDTYGDELTGINFEYNFKEYNNYNVRPTEWRFTNYTRAYPGAYKFVAVSPNREVSFDDMTKTAVARPMQIALNSGWFGLDIYKEGGDTVTRALHSPVVAMNADGSILVTSALCLESALPKIVHLFNKNDRGEIFFWIVNGVYNFPGSANSDPVLNDFIAKSNQAFFEQSESPKLDTHGTLTKLPSTLRNSFVLFLVPFRDYKK